MSSNIYQQMLDKIAANHEVVGVIGLGYVGLPLAVNFAEAGVRVLGFDKSAEKVDKINRGDKHEQVAHQPEKIEL